MDKIGNKAVIPAFQEKLNSVRYLAKVPAIDNTDPHDLQLEGQSSAASSDFFPEHQQLFHLRAFFLWLGAGSVLSLTRGHRKHSRHSKGKATLNQSSFNQCIGEIKPIMNTKVQ